MTPCSSVDRWMQSEGKDSNYMGMTNIVLYNVETTKSVKCTYFIVKEVTYLQDTVTCCSKKAIFSILS